MAKDQAVKLRGPDVRHVRNLKQKFKFPTAELIGAAVFGFQFLSAEQQMAAFQRREPDKSRSPVAA